MSLLGVVGLLVVDAPSVTGEMRCFGEGDALLQSVAGGFEVVETDNAPLFLRVAFVVKDGFPVGALYVEELADGACGLVF